MRHERHETVQRRRRWLRGVAVGLAGTCGIIVHVGPSVAAGASQPKRSPELLWRSFPLGSQTPRYAPPGGNAPAVTPAQTPSGAAARQASVETRPATSRPVSLSPVRELAPTPEGGGVALKLALIVLAALGIGLFVVTASGRPTIRRLLSLWDALLDRLYDLRLWVLGRPQSAANRLRGARASLRDLGWAVA